MIFCREFQIGLDDLNKEVKMKNKSILKVLEDIAGFHSDSIEMGINQIHKTGVAWALLEWEVQVLRRPKYGEKLDVHTWSRLNGRSFAYRDFEIYVGEEKCIIATSKWVLMDLNKRRPTVIKPELMAAYESESDKSVFEIADMKKLPEYDNYELKDEYKVRRCDIDINGHVHNLNYYDFVTETLTDEEEMKIDHFRISYRKEIRYGQTIRIMKCMQEGKHCFMIKDEEEKEIHSVIEMYF